MNIPLIPKFCKVFLFLPISLLGGQLAYCKPAKTPNATAQKHRKTSGGKSGGKDDTRQKTFYNRGGGFA
jgi:hypothetical protein